jgi:hypothetical protein
MRTIELNRMKWNCSIEFSTHQLKIVTHQGRADERIFQALPVNINIVTLKLNVVPSNILLRNALLCCNKIYCYESFKGRMQQQYINSPKTELSSPSSSIIFILYGLKTTTYLHKLEKMTVTINANKQNYIWKAHMTSVENFNHITILNVQADWQRNSEILNLHKCKNLPFSCFLQEYLNYESSKTLFQIMRSVWHRSMI